MNHWSTRRKRFVLLIIFLSLVVLIGVPTAFLFYDAPTCSDGKVNGDEEGIDCGGSCELLCPAESLPLLSKGDPRVIEVVPGFYEVVALVENPNVAGTADRARYTLKLFESSSVTPVKTISGDTYVPKSATFAIFEGPFDLGEARPTRATLEWDRESLEWRRDVSSEPNMSIRNLDLKGENDKPRVTASLVNNSLERVENIELVVVVRDPGLNTVAASKTVVESVAPGASAPIIFTWPAPFSEENVSVEILYRIFPDRSFIR